MSRRPRGTRIPMPTHPNSLTAIGFDADDTLWENETFYRMTEERFRDLLGGHAGDTDLSARLLEAEKRNLAAYGFGIKGFTLSMIETAIEVTDGNVPASVIGAISMPASPASIAPSANTRANSISMSMPSAETMVRFEAPALISIPSRVMLTTQKSPPAAASHVPMISRRNSG